MGVEGFFSLSKSVLLRTWFVLYWISSVFVVESEDHQKNGRKEGEEEGAAHRRCRCPQRMARVSSNDLSQPFSSTIVSLERFRPRVSGTEGRVVFSVDLFSDRDEDDDDDEDDEDDEEDEAKGFCVALDDSLWDL